MSDERRPLAALMDEWAIQIFSSPEVAHVEDARAALASRLADTPHHALVSTDGVRHFLVVETRGDAATVRRAHGVVQATGPMTLEHVHLPRQQPARAA